MANHYFRFKQFVINQEHCGMKVGTDGVLLGAWCNVTGCKRVLDIGTGTGLIALMVAQRNQEASVHAIEIDEDAFIQASGNFAHSPWGDRISAIKASFQEYVSQTTDRFDLIVSNPPYFENSLKSKGDKRTQARHTDSLPFETLIEGAAALLSPHGIISLVYPVDADERILALAQKADLYPVRRLLIKGNAALSVKRVLTEFSFEPSATTQEELLVVEVDRYVYSDDYKKLTGDFYLKM